MIQRIQRWFLRVNGKTSGAGLGGTRTSQTVMIGGVGMVDGIGRGGRDGAGALVGGAGIPGMSVRMMCCGHLHVACHQCAQWTHAWRSPGMMC